MLLSMETPSISHPKLHKTYSEVFAEYCEKGRLDKASETIRKQDSLWNNHIKDLFGDRYVDEVSNTHNYALVP